VIKVVCGREEEHRERERERERERWVVEFFKQQEEE
jgi:hypothetical protein